MKIHSTVKLALSLRRLTKMKQPITKEALEILIEDDISEASNFGIYLDYKTVEKNYLEDYKIIGEI